MLTTVRMLMLVTAGAMALAGCGRKQEAADTAAPPEASASAQPAPAQAAAPAEPTAEEKERAKKQAQLDFGTMEDQYLNDPRAQWAASAKASSSYGEEATTSYGPDKAAGKVDDKYWSSKNTSLGMDWVEAGYEKPVSATEVRVVFPGGTGVEAVTKIELIDTAGTLQTVWSGISEVKADDRGERTWFVRKFGATPYKAKGVKITIANNLSPGEKHIDAVQLVGD
jgi:hypothetical protein